MSPDQNGFETDKRGKLRKAVRVAAEQVSNGAQIIDVSMDDGMVDGVKAMTTFLNLAGADPALLPYRHADSSRWIL